MLCIVICVTSITVFAYKKVGSSDKTIVNVSKTYQTMNGFGASACWWAKEVGEWDNLDEIMALLYDSENGIGLNIYRYNLGADSDKDTLEYRADRWAQSFINEDGTYDFENKDVNAQNALACAEKAAGDDLRVTLFCNSAPIYMTKNSCGIANDYWWDSNLEHDQYEAFADYCYNCVEYFQHQGYRVTDISPMNEANGHWCRDNSYDEASDTTTYYDTAGQEGSYYAADEVRDLATVFAKRFDGSEAAQNGCALNVFEATDMKCMPYNEDVNEWYRNDHYLNLLLGKDFTENEYIKNSIDTISMHSYWTSREAKQSTAKLLKNYKNDNGEEYKLAQTEYCQMQDDIYSGVYDLVHENMTSGLGIEYGIALANIMADDLTILNVVEWDWWTAVAFGGYTDGLVYVDRDTHNIEASKRLYAMGNFSKFTDEGSTRVKSTTKNTELNTVAFSNPDGTVSVVFINNSDTEMQTELSLKGISTKNCSFTSYVTDETRNLEEYQSGNKNDLKAVTIPAKSITSVVVTP